MTAIVLSYWQQTIIKVGVTLALIPLAALILGYVFLLKMMSHMQSRLGPMEAGPHRRAPARGRRGEVHPEGGIFPDRPTAGCSRLARSSS